MFRDSSPLGRAIAWLARTLALAGGAALLFLIAMVVVSVVGRALIWAGLRPIYGDYEISEALIGFAIFAFLPWAHLTRGHAVVSLLTDRFGALANRWILVITDIMMLVAAAFITWRLYFGMMDKFAYGETSLLLRMPLGWAYAAGFVGAVVFTIIAIYVLGRSLTLAFNGEDEALVEPEAQG